MSILKFSNNILSFNNKIINTPNQIIDKGGSLIFGTANTYLTVGASSDWAVGSGDFAVEWFQFQTSLNSGNYPRIFSVGVFPNIAISVSIENGIFYAWTNNTYPSPISLTNFLNKWVHFAMVRSGGNIRVYKDGVRLINSANNQNITNSSSILSIGNDVTYETITRFPGRITNFHFVKGSDLGYSGTNIVVPSLPIIPTINTKLLLLATSNLNKTLDSGPLNKTIINFNNNVTWTNDNPF
jgi:hypothetical protein